MSHCNNDHSVVSKPTGPMLKYEFLFQLRNMVVVMVEFGERGRGLVEIRIHFKMENLY